MRDLLTRDFKLPFSPWWLLWTAILAVGFVIPNRSLPWLSFDRELVAVTWMVLLVIALLVRARDAWHVPVACIVLVALTVVPVTQFATGRIYFSGDAWLACLYLFGFSFAIAAGAQAPRVLGNQLLEALFAGLLAAALVSVGIAMYQWLRLSWTDFWVADMANGDRPFSNLGQPNHLATLIGWGLVGVWWLYLRRHIGAAVAWIAAAFLLFGLAMTQSRTGLVFVVVLLAGAFYFRRVLDSSRYKYGLLSLVLLLAFFVLIWGPLNRALYLDVSFGFQQRLQPGTRLHHWSEMLAAIADKPLWGWGWAQVAIAQQAVALRFPTAPELIDHSHNVILDLLVWNGLVVGVPLVVAAVWWLVSLVRKTVNAEGAMSLLAVAAFLVHALLEFPHTYAFFLLPAGLMLGTAWFHVGSSRPVPVGRTALSILATMTCAAYLWIAVEYYEAKQNLEVLRFESVRVGKSRDSKPPQLLVLTQLQAFLTANRYKLGEPATPERLELMRKVTERYPHHLLLLRYAMASASVGQVDVARDTLTRLCKLQMPGDCSRDLQAWRDLAQTTYPYLRAVKLPEQ